MFSFRHSSQGNSQKEQNYGGEVNIFRDPSFDDRDGNNLGGSGNDRFHISKAVYSSKSKYQHIQARDGTHSRVTYSGRCNTNPQQSEALSIPESYRVNRRTSNS